jgi:hypothetical protein
MSLLRFFLGTVMLTTGRRLYWLFLGMLGFVFAFDLAERAIHGQPYDVKLVFAVAAGVLGAGLAIFLQKFAILAGGFLAGGYLFVGLMRELGLRTAPYHWLLFVAGGLIGAFLMKVLFGWTLILLSSAMGAVLILQSLHLSTQITHPLFILLVVLGFFIQRGTIGRQSLSRRS